MASSNENKKGYSLLDDYPWLYQLYPSFMKTIRRNVEFLDRVPENVKYIPEGNKEEVILHSLKYGSEPEILYNILAEKDYTRNILLEAAKRGIDPLVNNKSEKIIDTELAKELIHIDLNYFHFLPEKVLTDEVKEEAVKIDGEVVVYMKKNDITKNMLEIILNDNISYGEERVKLLALYEEADQIVRAYKKFGESFVGQMYESIHEIKKEHFTQELADHLVEHEPWNIPQIPSRFLDQDRYHTAIINEPHALRFVPDKLVDLDMCMTAFHKSPSTVLYFPKRFLSDDELIKSLIKEHPSVIVYLDERKIPLSREMWEIAVQGFDKNPQPMGDKIPYYDLALEYVKKYPEDYNKDHLSKAEYAVHTVKGYNTQQFYCRFEKDVKSNPEVIKKVIDKNYTNLFWIKKYVHPDVIPDQILYDVCKKDPVFF